MLEAGFILLTAVVVILLIAMAIGIAKTAYTNAKAQRSFIIKTILFLILLVAYNTALSLTGIFINPSLPPRIPLLLVLPDFICVIYFFRVAKFKSIIAATPHSWIICFQTFRIFVELMIYRAVMEGILPEAASFAGYNYDILIGITAPIMALLFLRDGKQHNTLILIWNILGLVTLAIVVFILISQAYFYGIWGNKESILTKGFGVFPYTYLAGILMPVAVFMHIFSIVKVRSGSKSV